MRHFLLLSVAVISLTKSACAEGPMSAAELQKLAPGNYHVVAPGLTLEIKLAKGGAISGVTNKGDTDSGRWRIRGDQFCIRFKKWLDHNEKCERLARAGSEIKGSVFSIWKK